MLFFGHISHTEMNLSSLNEARRIQMCHSNPVPRKGILVISLPLTPSARTGVGPAPSARASSILMRFWMMQILLVSSEWTEIGTSIAKSRGLASIPSQFSLFYAVYEITCSVDEPQSEGGWFRIGRYHITDEIEFVHSDKFVFCDIRFTCF